MVLCFPLRHVLLQRDFNNSIKLVLEITGIRVLRAMHALNIHHLHFRPNGKEGLVPGV
jgi:hypothetical protein